MVDLKGKKDISHELQLLTSIGSNLFGTVLYQLSWDATGNKRFTFVSPNVKAYTGTSPEDIIQDPSILYGIISEKYIHELKQKEEDAYRTFSHFDVEVECTSENGEQRWIHIHSIPQKQEDGSVLWQGMITDITNSKHTEQKLSKYNHELTLLTKVNDLILVEENEQKLFENVCRIIVTEGGYTLAWIALHPNPADKNQNVVCTAAFGETRYIDEIHIDLSNEQYNKGPTATTLLRGTTSITNNFLESSQVNPWKESARKYGIAASIVISLEFEFRERGTLNIYSSNINAFDSHEVITLERLAKNVALAAKNIHNNREKNRTSTLLKERVKELQTLYLVKKILQNETESFDSLISKVVQLLPNGWQYPASCEARIQLHGTDYCTSHDYVSVSSQRADILISDKIIGCIEVSYTKEFPAEDEGPFFKEERELINVLAEILGNYCARKASIEALKYSEANLRSVFENAQIGFVLMDTAFTIVSINSLMLSEYASHTGIRLQLNQNYIDQIRVEQRAHITDLLNSVLRDQSIIEFETTFDSSEHPSFFNVTLVPVKNDNAVIGICLSAYNITKRKLMEQEREQITTDLIQRNRDLEQFAYIVSHNLRGPLSSILGLNSLLEEELEEDEKKIALAGIKQSADALDNVLNDLNRILQIRRDSAQQKELITLDTLLNNVKSSISHSILESKTIIESNFSKAPQILSVKAYLGSVFYNLISNSIKYARPGISPEIAISSEQTDKHIIIRYKDNGVGIDLHKYGNQLFGLYKRFHPKQEGKGIGLFMVKTQIEAMGGTIKAISEPDQGIEFIITFDK